MVNKELERMSPNLVAISRLVRIYLVIVLATLVVLAGMSLGLPHESSGGGSGEISDDAWVHAVVVALFASLLMLRARSARRGSVGALRAVGLISAVLFLANVLLVSIPGFLPTWMRVEAVGVALLMVGIIMSVVRERV